MATATIQPDAVCHQDWAVAHRKDPSTRMRLATLVAPARDDEFFGGVWETEKGLPDYRRRWRGLERHEVIPYVSHWSLEGK